MKRFLKTLTLLIVSLFLLVSGVDATLDHMTRSTAQSSYTWYNEKGDATFACTGDFALGLKPGVKPAVPVAPMPRVLFLHRTSATASDLQLISAHSDSGWF
ncbi:MAG TPA: hypothetical protein VGC39_03650 [Candidatus Methylacidiphilales bacterium]